MDCQNSPRTETLAPTTGFQGAEVTMPFRSRTILQLRIADTTSVQSTNELKRWCEAMSSRFGPGGLAKSRVRSRMGGSELETSLVSLVSAWGRNWCYSCGTVEGVETGETVEIATVHAGFMHVAENMVGWQKRLGEYPASPPFFPVAAIQSLKTKSRHLCSDHTNCGIERAIRSGRRPRRAFADIFGGILRRARKCLQV